MTTLLFKLMFGHEISLLIHMYQSTTETLILLLKTIRNVSNNMILIYVVGVKNFT